MSDVVEPPAPKKRRRRKTDKPPEPLGSLSQKFAVPVGTERCGSCESETLTRVPMALGDGAAVTFVSCQDCEDRVWVTDDATRLDLAEVLRRSERK